MALPRSKYVQEGQEGVYHCFSRCVRRAFLYGVDPFTGRDFSHRKAWLVDRLHQLASIFAIEVCAYAILANHYHTILRTRPDIVASWSDHEVATRWLTLCPRRCGPRGTAMLSIEEQIYALEQCPKRIATLRKRLCSLSWFMGRLNEFVARAANKEDEVKGRFWESRFKCQVLLDEAAIASCMVYVDLNPIRAGLASTPEESDFTSIQERIRTWHKETMQADSVPTKAVQTIPSGKITNLVPECVATMNDSTEGLTFSSSWLCPIYSEPHRSGILPMAPAKYFDLVDRSGRIMRPDKRGAIDEDLLPILLRIGAIPDAWGETVSLFGSKFRLAAGRLPNLRNRADQLGKRWFKGIAEARAAFTSSLT
jgi:putative transposase